MSKSLEALDKLCDLATQNSTCLNYVIGLAMNIKQDLEAYERLKQDHDKTLINNGELCVKVCKLEKENQDLKDKLNSEALDNWQLHCKYGKYKKAIEILKNKNVDIFFLRNNCEFVLENYNYELEDDIMKYCYKDCLLLTQQECDLLKEVLDNVK